MVNTGEVGKVSEVSKVGVFSMVYMVNTREVGKFYRSE
jgi:hypothetical protein